MNEFDIFLRRGGMSPAGPSFIEDLTCWEQLVTGSRLMNGRDFARLAQQDLPKAMAFLVGYATSFPIHRRPATPGELLGLIEWDKPEDRQAFVDAVAANLGGKK